MRPYHDATTTLDRRRVAEMRAELAGGQIEPDPAAHIAGLMATASGVDPTCARAFGEILGCLALPDEIFARPGMLEHVMSFAGKVSAEPLPGPNRTELLELLS